MSRVRKGSAAGRAVKALVVAGVVAGQTSGVLSGQFDRQGATPVALLAAESFIMTGTGMPDVTTEWMTLVSQNFITPTAGAGYSSTPVVTPAQFWPFTGFGSLTLDASTRLGSEILDARLYAAIEANRASGNAGDPLAVFGYSQSAWLAAIEKRALMDRLTNGEDLPPIDIVMLGNPIRPNGGLFSRLPSLGVVTWTPVLSAPTDTVFRTHDVARQYDPFADFPADLSNVPAVVNAVFGLANHDYTNVTLNPDDPRYDPNTVVQQYGDTTYYLIPSKLPMLEPLRQSGLRRFADALEPVLTPIVESGYDRGAPYGQHTPAYGQHTPAPPAAGRARVARVASGGPAAVHRTEKVGRSRR